jgi:hypothetical protein
MTATAKRRTLRKPAEERGRLTAKPLIVAGLVLTTVILWSASRLEHQAYAMDFSVGQSQASVETWSLPLPGRYAVVYWKSSPKSPQDGLRLFRRD